MRNDSELARLADRAIKGDAEDLDALLREIRPLVLSRCSRFLPNAQDAEEACQDTLLAVARRIGSFEGRARFTTWLYQVATNASIDCYRKLKRRQSVLVAPPEQSLGSPALSVLAGGRIDLLDALGSMDPKFAEPLALRDLCDLDYDQIAAQMGIKEGTAKSRVHEARERLRRQLYP